MVKTTNDLLKEEVAVILQKPACERTQADLQKINALQALQQGEVYAAMVRDQGNP